MRILKLAGAALVMVAIITVWIVGDRSRLGELQTLQAPAGETVQPTASATPEPPGIDTALPQVLSISLSTETIDTFATSQIITVTAHVTDDLSGLRFLVLRFAPANGVTQFVDTIIYGDISASGDKRDGIFQGQLRLPMHSAYGRWYISSVHVSDNVKNGCGKNMWNEILEMPECNLSIELPYFVNGEDDGTLPPPVTIEPSDPEPVNPAEDAQATPWPNQLRLPAVTP